MSTSAGVLIIFIVLIRAIALNRLPKIAFLMLWGVALLRLLVPVSIPAQFSFYSAVREFGSIVTPNNTALPIMKNAFFIGELPTLAAGPYGELAQGMYVL
jgi:hypothetical protein